MNRFIYLLALLASCTGYSTKPEVNFVEQELTQFVNPFIGTGGHGHTYPGATVPFGMVQLSPDTRLEGWDGCSGYHYTDSVIYGFSHTHLSGTGVGDYGDVLLMPSQEKELYNNGYPENIGYGYESAFKKESEKASPGYYEVNLEKHKIKVELTSSERVGFHRYTFSQKDGENKHIVLDLAHRDQLLGVNISSINDTLITGYRISNAWAKEQHIYFALTLSEPVEISYNNDSTKAILNFMANDSKITEVLVKVGISSVNVEGAMLNLTTEINHWNFDRVKQEAQEKWNKKLNKIQVNSNDIDRKTIFYSALYHTMIVPNLFSDIDGKYRGMDQKIHPLKKGENQYTVFSLWDTYRTTHPLYTIIEPEMNNAFIRSMLRQYEDGGILPIWELAGNYTGCMIGYHSIPVIADAYLKGQQDFDAELALKAMIHSANQDHLGLKDYKKNGYISSENESESVSKNLEYAYDDWCIAQMAKAMNKTKIAEEFNQRAQYYKNLYDPSTGFFRARRNGSWFGPFEPSEVNFNYTEANAWQYSLYAPQDISGHIELMGGKKKFTAHLDQLFSASSATSGREQADITGLIGQYAHGNEPSHHMAYLYNYANQPWKTQEKLTQIMDDLYHNAPDGLSGNEDCGQMSAWYVMTAMGFYPVTPGSVEYTIGRPFFNNIKIWSNNNKTCFNITARNFGKGKSYIRSLSLNGKPKQSSYISHADIFNGGELIFGMTTNQDKNFGTKDQFIPTTSISENLIVPLPYLKNESKTFTDSLIISMGCADRDASIYYTTDESEPNESSLKYSAPFQIDSTTIIKMIAIKEGVESIPITGSYYKIDHSKSIDIQSTYSNQYSGGGNYALIDHLRGSNDFRTGSWQGYQGQDLVATVDLGSILPVKEVSIGFLQDIKSWIFYPKQVSIDFSNDGKHFYGLKIVDNTFSDTAYGSFTQDLKVSLSGIKAKYVRINAKNYGVCPEWHLGAGGKTWLFADEIKIN